MDRRERMRRCYFNEELDRPGIYCRPGMPGDDPTYDRLREYLQAHTELKGGWGFGGLETSYATETRRESHSDDFERHIVVLHTPKGDLERTSLQSLKGLPGLHETFFLKTREDAERYLSLPLPEIAGDVSSFFEADARMADRGIVEVGLGFNAAGFVAELCGSEAFAIMSLTDRDVLHALCQQQMQARLNRVKFAVENQLGPYFSMLGQEYLVPPLHGRKDFYDFNVKYDKPVIDLIHEAGGRIHIHSHGSIKHVFDGFVEMGADVLHPFEAPPLGDITPAEAKSFAGGKLCLEGNIQIHRLYEATPDELRQETAALIDICFDDHRGLSVSATASPFIRGEGETCFPQYKAMIDTVLEWQA